MTGPHHIAVLALPRVVAFDLTIPAQIFGHEDESAHYRLTVCAPAPGTVPTTTGFGIATMHGLEALAEAGTVIVPGYEPLDDPGTEVRAALRSAHERGARIVSICTGAFALAHAGLLDGLSATTHWRHAADLQTRFPAVTVEPGVLYLDNGTVLTSAGISAGIDLCLHLVRSDLGQAAATRIARRMVVGPYRPGGQAQYIETPMPAGHDALAPVLDWALAHLDRPITVAELSDRAHLSTRTFARRFTAETGTTPLRWLRAQRLSRARELLESTDLPVEQIAGQSGFGAASTLRAHFTNDLDTTPTAYRRAFRGSRHQA